MANTPTRTMRISDHVWAAVSQRARLEDITVTELVKRAVCEYVSTPLPRSASPRSVRGEQAGDLAARAMNKRLARLPDC